MRADDHFYRAARMGAILNALKNYELTVEVGSDFNRYRALRASFSDERPLYPMFDIGVSFIDASNGLYVAARDPDGALVHTQAMRLFDFGTRTLENHFADHRQKYVTPGLVADPCAARFDAGPVLNRISGKVCYHGDFWLGSASGGLRRGGAMSLLSHLAFALAEATWTPDFVFAFIAARQALQGTPIRHGYVHSAPGRWIDDQGAVFAEEWLVWMDAADLATLGKAPVETAAPMAGPGLQERADRPEACRINGTERCPHGAPLQVI
jgi:hypothetical protein